MLAKVWKKVLLAICIVACIYNVMSKLVNRHSLEENLESANDGTLVFNVFTDNEQPSTTQIVKDALKELEANTAVTQENVTQNAVTNEEVNKENTENKTKEDGKNKSGISFSDFTLKF